MSVGFVKRRDITRRSWSVDTRLSFEATFTAWYQLSTCVTLCSAISQSATALRLLRDKKHSTSITVVMKRITVMKHRSVNVMSSGVARICCEEGQSWKLCHGALTTASRPGAAAAWWLIVLWLMQYWSKELWVV